MMNPARHLGWVGVVLLVAGGCAAQGSDTPRSWQPEVTGEKQPTKAPDAAQNADAGGEAPAECKPKTCTDLGKTTGKHDDGCGGEANCGNGCAPDAKAGNGSAEKAADLGEMTDYPASNRKVENLVVGEGDEDWFKFRVSDNGFGGNPVVAVKTSVAAEVSVFYLCDSATTYSACTLETDTPDDAVGKGCRGKSKVSLDTSCDGITETGTAYVRVKKTATDACTTYALEIDVD